ELGYAQYEVSNFAKPDAACLHNVNTWRMQEWIGCGPSAASQYEGQRYQRPSNLDEWAKGMEAGLPPRTECVDLDASILLADALVFGLRMNAGCDLDLIAKQFPAPDVLAQLEPLLSRLAREGLAEREGSKIRLTHEGRLVCDAIGSSILETIAD
ncbi:MAG: coproporphyrinogen III oxidase, partial [Opitutales bacterium]|nr:coproporphyrinogen III oxidase [Opitutales bacterium]